MSKVLVSKEKLDTLSETIKTKAKKTNNLTIDEMNEAVSGLETEYNTENDMLQKIVSAKKSTRSLLEYTYSAITDFTFLEELDTSEVTDMQSMFAYCSVMTKAPMLNTSKVQYTNHMFNNCQVLVEIPEYDFVNLKSLKSISYMFSNCYALVETPPLDLTNVTTAYTPFQNCRALEIITLYNIKINLQVGSGTSYGHLLTVDSLVGLCKECIKQSSSRTLTVGSANLEKLASVYVKFTDITQTTIATGEKGEVEVCESTDTGAMLIEDYMTLKTWVLA